MLILDTRKLLLGPDTRSPFYVRDIRYMYVHIYIYIYVKINKYLMFSFYVNIDKTHNVKQHML